MLHSDFSYRSFSGPLITPVNNSCPSAFTMSLLRWCPDSGCGKKKFNDCIFWTTYFKVRKNLSLVYAFIRTTYLCKNAEYTFHFEKNHKNCYLQLVIIIVINDKIIIRSATFTHQIRFQLAVTCNSDKQIKIWNSFSKILHWLVLICTFPRWM